jgi:ribosomal protein L13
MLGRLRIFAGPEHQHAAQSPKRITFNEKGDIQVV